ncbi:MAG: porin [Collimonas sp.]|uniref:porin n=1 Tax=Collimonas sp. TaxID=1963772 RepID=UPI0032672E12
MRNINFKFIPVFSILAAACSQSNAQSATQIYGLVNLGISSQQLSGQSRVSTVSNGDMTTSFFGIRGSEDLGGGLKAVFTMESFFRADTGELGRGNSDVMFQRQSWVGLSQDGAGSLRIGRLPSPNWLTTIRFGPFGGASITPYILQTYLPSALQPMITGSSTSDASWANSVGYSSPVWAGFSMLAVYAMSEGGSNGKRFGGSFNYEAGALAASLSFEKLSQMSLQFGAPVPALVTAARPNYVATDDNTAQLAVAYDFNVLKLFGQLSQTRLQNTTPIEITLTTSQLGVSVPAAGGKLMASWAQTRMQQTAKTDLQRATFSFGYDYNLSKRSDVYAALISDKVSNLSRGNGFTIGLRHSF